MHVHISSSVRIPSGKCLQFAIIEHGDLVRGFTLSEMGGSFHNFPIKNCDFP